MAIQRLRNIDAGRYVSGEGLTIVRSISAFEATDVLHQSQLDPMAFVNEDSGLLELPSMLWQLSNDEWLAVEDATVGYGGTGPRLAKAALRAAGVDEVLAEEIVSWRFCDAVDMNNRSSWQSQTTWPVHPRGAVQILQDRIIVHVGDAIPRYGSGVREELLPEQRAHGQASGFYPTPHNVASAWLEYLDVTDDPWAVGERVCRIFLDRDSARAQGFILEPPLAGSSSPTLVIEQGHIQIWAHLHRNYASKTELLPDRAWELLNEAGMVPQELAKVDARTQTWWQENLQLLRRWFQFGSDLAERIGYADVSAEARIRLRFIPANVS